MLGSQCSRRSNLQWNRKKILIQFFFCSVNSFFFQHKSSVCMRVWAFWKNLSINSRSHTHTEAEPCEMDESKQFVQTKCKFYYTTNSKGFRYRCRYISSISKYLCFHHLLDNLFFFSSFRILSFIPFRSCCWFSAMENSSIFQSSIFVFPCSASRDIFLVVYICLLGI